MVKVNDFENPKKIILDNTGIPTSSPGLDPHEVIFSPDISKYFVTCQGSNEIRVINTADDKLLAVIPTGEFPQEMGVSKTTPYLFVSCMDDTTTNSQQKSSIMIINYNSLSVVKSLYAGYQSHGIAVDDENKRVYISNRNILASGPSPHHQGVCAGRNGNITAIDLNTLNLIPNFKSEVSIDPYGIGISH